MPFPPAKGPPKKKASRGDFLLPYSAGRAALCFGSASLTQNISANPLQAFDKHIKYSSNDPALLMRIAILPEARFKWQSCQHLRKGPTERTNQASDKGQKKAPDFHQRLFFKILVAGVGFEPTTFGL
jgi:hypothetical protein